VNGLTLWIEDGLFERDVNVGFHRRRAIIPIASESCREFD
jgi:hypothetical protein